MPAVLVEEGTVSRSFLGLLSTLEGRKRVKFRVASRNDRWEGEGTEKREGQAWCWGMPVAKGSFACFVLGQKQEGSWVFSILRIPCLHNEGNDSGGSSCLRCFTRRLLLSYTFSLGPHRDSVLQMTKPRPKEIK